MAHSLLLGLMTVGLIAAICSGAVLFFVPQWIANRRPHLPETAVRVRRWQSWSFAGLLASAFLVLLGALLLNSSRPSSQPAAAPQAQGSGPDAAVDAGADATPPDVDGAIDEAPAPAKSRAAVPKPPATSASLDPQTDARLRSFLRDWAYAMESNDPEREAAFYADRLDRYFLYQNVSKRAVMDDKRRFVHSGKRLQSFALQDVALDPVSPMDVKVRLVKRWQLAPPDPGHSTQSRLELKNLDGSWKITTEQDLK